MKSFFMLMIIPVLGCAANFDLKPMILSDSTPFLNESVIVKTYENLSAFVSFPLNIKAPDEFKSYKYFTLIASKTKNTGGWKFIPNLVGDKLNYCLRGPAPLAPVTMALSTPYLIVAHNEIIEIREVFTCN